MNCLLCGYPLPQRRWWQLVATRTCKGSELDGCRRRFVAAFMTGRVVPPSTPRGRWVSHVEAKR